MQHYIENKRQSLVVIGQSLWLEMGYIFNTPPESDYEDKRVEAFPVIRDSENNIFVPGMEAFESEREKEATDAWFKNKGKCFPELARSGQILSWNDFCHLANLFCPPSTPTFVRMRKLISELRFFDVKVDSYMTRYILKIHTAKIPDESWVCVGLGDLPFEIQCSSSADLKHCIRDLRNLYEDYLLTEIVLKNKGETEKKSK